MVGMTAKTCADEAHIWLLFGMSVALVRPCTRIPSCTPQNTECRHQLTCQIGPRGTLELPVRDRDTIDTTCTAFGFRTGLSRVRRSTKLLPPYSFRAPTLQENSQYVFPFPSLSPNPNDDKAGAIRVPLLYDLWEVVDRRNYAFKTSNLHLLNLPDIILG